jgi:RES domain
LVRIDLPPPHRSPNPIFHTVPVDTRLVRIFDPSVHNQTVLTFRTFGPLRRFDHHRAFGDAAAEDAERGIYYAAFDLEGCIVEVYGDTKVVDYGEKQVASPVLTRDLQLLDLRRRGAMRAGSVAALSQNADYGPSQHWSRYFYEHPEIYGPVDGILYASAHNEGDLIAIYERGSDALTCEIEFIIPLNSDNPEFRTLLQYIGLQNHILVPPLRAK